MGVDHQSENLDGTSRDQLGLLGYFEHMRQKALHGFTAPEAHPWFSFAHPDLKTEEFEALSRSLRYLSIHLSKFWVEIQSCPTFMNAPNINNIEQIEKIINWLISSPSWADIVESPKVIPELAQPASRKIAFEFMRNVLAWRALRAQVLVKMEDNADLQVVRSACDLSKVYSLGSWTKPDLEFSIREVKCKLENLGRINRFFSELSTKSGSFVPVNANEAKGLLRAVRYIKEMPEGVRGWRQKQIIGAAQKIRIQTWYDRARPILELRKKLEPHFRLDEPVDLENLHKIEGRLKAPKLLYGFSATYKDAVQSYQQLLRGYSPDKKMKSKDTRLEMSERISDWLSYIEQRNQYQRNSEAKAAFDTHFKGIDTDFVAAAKANEWASAIRSGFGDTKGTSEKGLDYFETEDKGKPTSGSELGTRLAEFIFNIPASLIEEAIQFGTGTEAEAIAGLLDQQELSVGKLFTEIKNEAEFKVSGMSKLHEALEALKLHNDVPFSALEELYVLSQEISFIKRQIETGLEKSAYLKSIYNGFDTNLAYIEQGLDYLKFIANSSIPQTLKNTLLSYHGPQRLADTSKMVAKFIPSLGTVREHFRKAEILTQGQMRTIYENRSIEEVPVQLILEKIVTVLKYPDRLPDWVEYLKVERNVKLSNAPMNGNESHSLAKFQTESTPRMH